MNEFSEVLTKYPLFPNGTDPQWHLAQTNVVAISSRFLSKWYQRWGNFFLNRNSCLIIKFTTEEGSSCGYVDKAVASLNIGPQFKSSHQHIFCRTFFAVNCIEKMKIKKKRPGIPRLKYTDKRRNVLVNNEWPGSR